MVTFLLTDVEGSTRRWEADADGMRVALAAHDEVLRNAIEQHGGFLFKHTGDGVCGAFNSPKSAVDAAAAAQRELQLPVRMGIATGEAELREGDYFGAVLNRAARVMAAGHGGQILLADSTPVLLSGVDLVDLGRRRLRDVPMPLGAYGFAWRNADPDRALEAMHRGLAGARDSGNRFNETHIAANLAQLDVERGDPLSALEHISIAIRHLHDSGNRVTLRSPFTNLAVLLDRLEHHESAATIAGFAFSPLTAASFPKINAVIAHLRDVLGEQTYESLARSGATMTTAEVVAYAHDQMDQARAELNAVSK